MIVNIIRITVLLKLFRNAIDFPYIVKKKMICIFALCLSCFVFFPTLIQIYQEIYIPFKNHKIQIHDSIVRESRLICDFMLNHIDQVILQDCIQCLHVPNSVKTDVMPINILFPSFIISELKTIFHLGMVILIPFIIIDIIIAGILTIFGLMINTKSISFPIKLILFLLLDGSKLFFSSIAQMFF